MRIERAANAAPLAHRVEATIDAIQPVVVVVTVRGHSLVLLDPWLKALSLPSSGDAVTCEFRIEGKAEGEADVAVQFLQGDSPLGSLSFSSPS